VKERGRIYSAIVDAAGTWKVLLDAEASAGPFTISAYTETATITLHDVLFGDIFNGTEEMKKASQYHQIRVFTADRQFSKQPLTDLKAVAEMWSLPSNDSLGHTWQYFSAVCWLYGKYLYEHFGVPVGLIDTVWGGTPVEAWMSKDALAKCGLTPQGFDAAVGGAGDNGELWNAMVHPFLPMTIYGVIWDQGESDAGPVSKRNNYNCTFPAMIDDWRGKFSNTSGGQTNATFPFGFVQIGAKFKDATVSSGFPDIRWQQTADYGYVPNPRMKNVFMAVSVDLPDFTSPYAPVHTRDKQDVAYRLFLGGLSVAYGVPTLFQGPLPIKMTQLADSLVLDYGTTWTLQVLQREGFEFELIPNMPESDSFWTVEGVRVCGGDWGLVAGVGGLWRESGACGGSQGFAEGDRGLWRGSGACGGSRGFVAGLGGLWRDSGACGRTLGASGRSWGLVEGVRGLWRDSGTCGGTRGGACGGSRGLVEGVGGFRRDSGGLWRDMGGLVAGVGGLWRESGGLVAGVGACGWESGVCGGTRGGLWRDSGGLWRGRRLVVGLVGLWRDSGGLVAGLGGLVAGLGGLVAGLGGLLVGVRGLWRESGACGGGRGLVAGVGGLWRDSGGLWRDSGGL
ncbi:hypothetical protein BaRGS_00028086, partial [Batillaria attramentaria]